MSTVKSCQLFIQSTSETQIHMKYMHRHVRMFCPPGVNNEINICIDTHKYTDTHIKMHTHTNRNALLYIHTQPKTHNFFIYNYEESSSAMVSRELIYTQINTPNCTCIHRRKAHAQITYTDTFNEQVCKPQLAYISVHLIVRMPVFISLIVYLALYFYAYFHLCICQCVLGVFLW